METPSSTRKATPVEVNDTLLALGGEIGTSMVDSSSSCHRDPVRIGRRGLFWWDDDVPVVEDSEKLPLVQRSTDFRRTTRRGGEEGAQVVMVHRNCCDESTSGSIGDDKSFDRKESYMVFSKLSMSCS